MKSGRSARAVALGFFSLCACGQCLLVQGALLGRDWLGLGMERLVWRGADDEEHPGAAEPKGDNSRATCSQLQMGGRCKKKKKVKKTRREDKSLNSEWTKARKRSSGNLS